MFERRGQGSLASRECKCERTHYTQVSYRIHGVKHDQDANGVPTVAIVVGCQHCGGRIEALRADRFVEAAMRYMGNVREIARRPYDL
jgi:hypothetical protein